MVTNPITSETPNRTPMIILRDICLVYDEAPVLDGISFTVYKNEVVALVGPSGAGKTSLIKIITGLVFPDSGEAKVMSDRIGMAFQYGALFTSLTVKENIALVLEQTIDLEKKALEERIGEALTLVGLAEEGEKYPNELSGGMQKRVGIARALAIHPDIMIYDEPSAGLDPILAERLEKDLRRINEERGMATLVVTHELPTVWNLADRVIMLYEGRIVYEGTKEDFFSTHEPYVLQFRARSEIIHSET